LRIHFSPRLAIRTVWEYNFFGVLSGFVYKPVPGWAIFAEIGILPTVINVAFGSRLLIICYFVYPLAGWLRDSFLNAAWIGIRRMDERTERVSFVGFPVGGRYRCLAGRG